MTRRAATLISGAALFIALVLLANWTKVPYAELQPGPTFDTLGSYQGKQLITIEGGKTYEPSGQLRMLTVEELTDLHVYDVISGWFNDDRAVVPSYILNPPGQTQQQRDQEGKDQFNQSQSAATTVALRHEGYPVMVTIGDVVAGLPADGHLMKGDVVVSVDGRKLLSGADLGAAIQGKPVGTEFKIDYTRGGQPGQTTIKSVAAAGDGHPQIGVNVENKQDSPYKITFTLDNVDGPSAGMMFTLGVIDKLEPGDITGGKIVAGTGTMDDDGNVGPIGGIQQKMVGAYNAGARFFLAPADNCAEALQHPVAGLTLAKVATIDDALAALADIRAGKTPPTCTK
jgi:PDZ domain-containing protein